MDVQQNTAYELHALSTQWKELCAKNIEIEAACAQIKSRIEELKSEAAERLSILIYCALPYPLHEVLPFWKLTCFCLYRGWNLEANVENGITSHMEQ